ncbi:MAG: hypothetical protein HFJ31_00790 [Clostridia bacterium]|jgi:hypothetical protein|nr:hypothetical protein [Clostridia bacterium]
MKRQKKSHKIKKDNTRGESCTNKSIVAIYNNINGITLVALVVTIVVLLILVGITLTYVLGDNSIFKQASDAKLETELAKAREKIEIVLSEAKIPKHTDNRYNENEYLDEFIFSRISNTEVLDEVIITDGYAFSLDRSVPKIGEYLGKKEELVFPEINATVTRATDNQTAIIHIIAKEAINGISKIEVIQEGHVIETYTYENEKEQITEDYVVKQNGTYIIKVYAKLSEKTTVEVNGIVMSMEYTPNGNREYKKEHQVKISVNETDEKVKSIKYQWLNTTAEPETNTFTETCNNGATLEKSEVTGSYYLWTLLETEKGKTKIERSEAFNFDNQGPQLAVSSVPISENSFSLNATAEDLHVQSILKYEFYVEGELVSQQKTVNDVASFIVEDVTMGEKECYVFVYDSLGNLTRKELNARTKMHTWEKWMCNAKRVFSEIPGSTSENHTNNILGHSIWYSSYSFSSERGFYGTGKEFVGIAGPAQGYPYRIYNEMVQEYRNVRGDSSYSYTLVTYRATSTIVYSKGTSRLEDVRDSERNAFPDDSNFERLLVCIYWYTIENKIT